MDNILLLPLNIWLTYFTTKSQLNMPIIIRFYLELLKLAREPTKVSVHEFSKLLILFELDFFWSKPLLTYVLTITNDLEKEASYSS